MKILVINAGSSSIKYQLVDMTNEIVIAKGMCDRVGQQSSTLIYKGKSDIRLDDVKMPSHVEAMKFVLDALVHADYGVIKNLSEVSAVGHRVVLGGEDYTGSVVIDETVMKALYANIGLAPLHNPANIQGIEACKEIMPTTPMVAVFDNAFHSSMPDYAYLYAINYDDYKKHKIRKYGFHGTSHMFISQEVERITGKKDNKIVIAHLGNGASMSAVKNGKSIDTSMGLTPLQGLVMGTRCGDIDAAAVEYLVNNTDMDVHQVTTYLNKKCGLLGISGLSSDFRDLEEEYAKGDKCNPRARLAIEMFCYRVKSYVGSYAAAMGGIDCLVFTGGIGENSSIVREKVVEGLEFLGLELDKKANDTAKRGEMTLFTTGKKVKGYVIPTNEEIMIARDTLRLVK
ncbi:MAG: acetate kinase [Firmicutes bacterium]|nr:acetate kinase [Bacillota bacterium]MCL2256007.1 acetate kinase [Bacillota bacterium]